MWLDDEKNNGTKSIRLNESQSSIRCTSIVDRATCCSSSNHSGYMCRIKDLCEPSSSNSYPVLKTAKDFPFKKSDITVVVAELREECKNFFKRVEEFRASSHGSFLTLHEEKDKVEGGVPEQNFYSEQLVECTKLSVRGIAACMDCSATEKTHCCRFKGFRLLKNADGRNAEPATVSFPIYDVFIHKDHHKRYLPFHSERCIVLSEEKCCHLVVHLLPALERMYDLERRAWRAMKLQLGANNHMPFWKKDIGDREICDCCATTIFNLHVMCFYCGFARCPKCFLKGPPNGSLVSCARGGGHHLVPVCIVPDVPNSPLSTLQQVVYALQSMSRKLGLQGTSLSRYYDDHMKLFQSCSDPPEALRICDGKLVVIPSLHLEKNLAPFHRNWRNYLPVIVKNLKVNKELWNSDWFCTHAPRSSLLIAKCIVDCRTGMSVGRYQHNHGVTQQEFWRGYGDVLARRKDKEKRRMLLKLKDFPPHDTFKNILPAHYEDYCKALAVKIYTLPHLQNSAEGSDGGHLNLALFLPDWISKPDLGPKLYVAFGMLDAPDKSTTNLHLDITCAANLMCDVTVPKGVLDDHAKAQLCDFLESEGFKRGSVEWMRVILDWEKAGAIWTIWHPADNEKIRNGITEMVKVGLLPLPQGVSSLSEIDDPINDQCFYLTGVHRRYLEEHFDVHGCTLIQMEGDLVFVPAGAAHQVQNLFSCIKAAEDFVSPEGIYMSEVVGNEFRYLTSKHANHEDKLQLSNIIYFAAVETLSSFDRLQTEIQNGTKADC